MQYKDDFFFFFDRYKDDDFHMQWKHQMKHHAWEVHIQFKIFFHLKTLYFSNLRDYQFILASHFCPPLSFLKTPNANIITNNTKIYKYLQFCITTWTLNNMINIHLKRYYHIPYIKLWANLHAYSNLFHFTTICIYHLKVNRRNSSKGQIWSSQLPNHKWN